MYTLNLENDELKVKIEEGMAQFNAMKARLEQLRETVKRLREELSQAQMQNDVVRQERRRAEDQLADMQEKYMKAVRLAMSQEKHIRIGNDHMTPDLQRHRSQLLMDDDSDERTDLETLADKRELLRVQSGVNMDFDDVSETEVSEATELTSIGEVDFGVRFADEELSVGLKE